MTVLVIIGQGDIPIYQSDFLKGEALNEAYRQDHFLIHAALDMVDEQIWQGTAPFLRTVDTSDRGQILAYITPGHSRFMLYVENFNPKMEPTYEAFFKDVHELYVKVLLNPFYKPNTPITSAAFDAKVKYIGGKYFS